MDSKDGRRRGRHHSLSQLTRPTGVGALPLSLSLFSFYIALPHSARPPSSRPRSFSLPSLGETEGEGSVAELTVAVHFTVRLKETEVNRSWRWVEK